MATLTRIPDLTETEFRALFYLFSQGLNHSLVAASPAALGALHALQAAQPLRPVLPGENSPIRYRRTAAGHLTQWDEPTENF
jgi:hypothetical protein